MIQEHTSDRAIATMKLLWRSEGDGPSPPSPGPKPRLTVDDVVEAAVVEADANRVGDVSMRAIAERLDVTAMTLYGYVPGKEALVALMYDSIHAEMTDQDNTDDGWRPRVVAWAEDLVDLYLRHPWALRVSYARPVLGPHEQRVLELVAGHLRDTNLASDLLRRVIGMLFHVVRGTALTIAEARLLSETSEIGEREWWQQSSTALAAVVPDFGERFPNTVWLLSDRADTTVDTSYVDREARANLRVGLGVLLDGIDDAIESAE